jgi:hypothetical protein
MAKHRDADQIECSSAVRNDFFLLYLLGVTGDSCNNLGGNQQLTQHDRRRGTGWSRKLKM